MQRVRYECSSEGDAIVEAYLLASNCAVFAETETKHIPLADAETSECTEFSVFRPFSRARSFCLVSVRFASAVPSVRGVHRQDLLLRSRALEFQLPTLALAPRAGVCVCVCVCA